MGKWLTPLNSEPVERVYRLLSIPNDAEWASIIWGALDDLRYSSNFEQLIGISPEETASAFALLFDEWRKANPLIGVIFPFATAALPANSLSCNGATYLRTDYPELYARIHSSLIVDADHFKVPDLRARFVTMASGSAPGGLTPKTFNSTGGEERHTLTTSEMPSHSHSEVGAAAVIINGGLEAPASSAVPTPAITGFSGGGGPHENMPPWIAVNWAIWAR